MNDQEFFLKTYRQAAHEVTECLTSHSALFASTFAKGDMLGDEVRRFITHGGKRLRPALSLIIARAYGHSDPFVHIALETFHKYLLAHDDIIDRDSLRYGAPTVHAKLATRCPTTDATHFGMSMGIIGGNLMEAATHKIILHSQLPAATKIALEQLIVQATEEVTWGWYDQFLMDYLPLDSPQLSFERIEKSIIWVTGKYSIKLPLLFGYAVADKTPPEALDKLADTLGLLFQTGDDLFGIFGNSADTGKSNFGDIVQGKKTLPLWLSYEAAAPSDKKTLLQLIGKHDITPEEVEIVRCILHNSGGVDSAKSLLHTYRQDSLTQLAALDLPPDLQTFLRGFIAYLETRDR